jgi:hypothetical protein
MLRLVSFVIPPDHQALAIMQNRGVEAEQIATSTIGEGDQVRRQPRVEVVARVEVDADDVHSGGLRSPNTVDIDRAVRSIAELQLEPPIAVRELTPQRLLGGRELLLRRRPGDDIRAL